MSAIAMTENPFVGLRPFESEDSIYFFGRGEQTYALLCQLHKDRFVAVVGSSGSGKSSLVRAGLIPQLEAGFLAQDRDAWLIARMKPGTAPLVNLCSVLLPALGLAGGLEEAQAFAQNIRRKGLPALLEVVAPVLERQDANLMLLVDQFEEVFRFGSEAAAGAVSDDARELVTLVLQLAECLDVPVYTCMTMRSDFLGDCNIFSGLPEALNQGQYLVPSLNRDQHREAIVGPIQLSGAKISPRLIDRLLNERLQTRDDLPVLQHALMRTWSAWAEAGEGPIDVPHYEEIHTLEGALNEHADEALRELSPEQGISETFSADQAVAKRMFQALTESDLSNRRIRRPAHLSELAGVCNCSSDRLLRIIEVFRSGGRNFLVLSREQVRDDPLIDISHESLIRQWKRLAEWVEEEAQSAKIYQRLANTAEDYPDRAGLYQGTDLEVAWDWQERVCPTETWARRYHSGFERAIWFLNESHDAQQRLERQQREATKERERLLREKNELLEGQTRQQRKSLRQTRRFLALVGVLLIAAAGAAWFATMAWKEADRQSQLAEESRREANFNLSKVYQEKAHLALVSARKNRSSETYRSAWLYATEALSLDVPHGQRILEPAAIGGFLDPNADWAFAESWFSPTLNLGSAVNSVAFSPDGQILATGSWNNGIGLWDTESGALIRSLGSHKQTVTAVAFSSDGKILAGGSWDKTVLLSDVSTGEVLRILEGHEGAVLGVAFSPDGRILASASSDGTIRLWNVSDGKLKGVLEGHNHPVTSVAFSPDGKTLASGSWDDTVGLWDVGQQSLLRKLKGHTAWVNAVAFGPNGEILVSGSDDKTTRVWELSTGQSRSLRSEHGQVNSVSISPDGKVLASAARGVVEMWDVAAGKRLRVLEGPVLTVQSVAFSPDGRSLASGSLDKTVRFWDTATGRPLHNLPGHTYAVLGVAFSPDGETMASASVDRTIRLWDKRGGEEATLKGHTRAVTSVAFDPAGKTLISGSWDNSVRVWNIADRSALRVLEGHTRPVFDVAFSPDGATFASGSADSTVRLWDASTGALLHTLNGELGPVTSVAYSPDGTMLAAGCWNNAARLWDLSTYKTLRILAGHQDRVTDVAFDPRGEVLATSSSDHKVRLWDTRSERTLPSRTASAKDREQSAVTDHDVDSPAVLEHDGPVSSVSFSPDGRVLASGSSDKTVRLWRVDTLKQLVRLDNHSSAVTSVAFGPNGRFLISGAWDNRVRLWNVAEKRRPQVLAGHSDKATAVAFSPDGRILASGSSDFSIRLWDAATGTTLHVLRGNRGRVNGIAFSPDGKILASAASDNRVRLWDTATRKLLRTLSGHTDEVTSVAFSPDGRILASGSLDGDVRLWSPQEGELLRVLEDKGSIVNDVAILPDGKTLISASNRLNIWDMPTGRLLRTMEGHRSGILGMAVSPDGSTLASSSWDDTLRLWDLTEWRELQVLTGETERIRSIAFSPDGMLLASGSEDNRVRLWNSKTGQVLQTLEGHSDIVLGVAFSPNGQMLASASADKTVRIWYPDLRVLGLLAGDEPDSAEVRDFAEALRFVWGEKVVGLDILPAWTPTLFPRTSNYFFEYSGACSDDLSSLLRPPAAAASKMDQITQWTGKQSQSSAQKKTRGCRQ